MANPLLDTISDVGYALDTPGALLRGLLAGRPGSRASGTDLLDAYGLPGGPVGGFAAEMVLDPLAIAGPALGAFRGLRGLSHADDAAPLMRRLGELGGGGGGLDRRLADLAGHADPMDALRAGYRGTVGAPSPASDAFEGAGDAARRFLGGGEAGEFGGLGTSSAGLERADVLGSGLTEGMRKRPQTGKMTAGEVARFDARAQGDELFNPGMSDDEARYAEVLGALGRTEPRPGLFDDLTAPSRPTPMGGADDAYAGFGREYLDRFGDVGTAIRRFLGTGEAGEFGGLRPFLEIGRRTDPDYINSVPWFHGSGTPGITPATLDPMKTDPSGLFGRGIYTTADPKVAGVGAESYAETRAREGMARWSGSATSQLRRWLRENPGRGAEADRAMLDSFRAPGAFGRDFLKKVVEMAEDPAYASSPGKFAAWNAHYMGMDPAMTERAVGLYSSLGVPLPPRPSPTLYQAGTDFSNILDLDLPADPKLVGSMRGMVESLVPTYRAESPDALTTPLDWLDEAIRRPDALNSDVLEAAKPSAYADTRSGPDVLIKALREAGYDALSHTGGMRAGGGRNLHQVLIGLDPNDTISGVGRANQIPRFDALDPDAILRLLAGGS